MESKNGRFDDMEDRTHSGSFRQKSKVPRARYSQRCEYSSEYSSSDHRNGSVKNTASFLQGVGSAPSHQSDTDEYKEWQKLIGERVCISGVKQGILRYYGRTTFAQGFWCGVELDEPVGKNNGTVNGVVYFTCKPNHGIFAPVNKVSRLNDLSVDWRAEARRESFSRQTDQFQSGSNWEYNLRYATESVDHKFIKNSPSDPSFMRSAHRSNLPHKSESFPYDKRNLTEQREHTPFSVKDLNFEMSDVTSKRGRMQSGNLSSKNSSCILTKYGYGAKNQFFSSNVVCLSDKTEISEPARDKFAPTRSDPIVPKKISVSASSHNQGRLSPMEDYEHYLRTPTNSGEASPQASDVKRFGDMSFFDYKIPEILNAFQSRDYPDPEDEMDNDDQMSGDYDESLGILTPSQMKDFTLCPDLPTSCSDLRGIDFPSSESFDDINDLPEDEQVSDVSVQYLPESASATRVLEVAKQNGVGSFAKNDNALDNSKLDSMISSTDKFLFSISQKNYDDFNLESHYLSGSDNSRSSAKQCEGAIKLNNLSAINVLSANRVIEKELPEKLNLGFEPFSATCSKESRLATNALCSTTSDISYTKLSSLTSDALKVQKRSEDSHNLSDSNKIALRNYSEADIGRKNYDTDSSRDSLLQAESETNSALKEKLTVSWEDCVSQNNDCMYTPVERPESVYTVASSDTGFQEDAEIDADAGMGTSIDSTDGTKRFSTMSRDSCIVTEEMDGYKIAESNSTSGYSTGLSDSCCNDRPDDDISSKRLTDEEIQDSVGPCDSEDAFSFQENSLSKDGEVGTAEISDVTVEAVTALCHDSTSDALCETMVEDATLTEINELLLSPEDNQKILEDKENNDMEMDHPKDIISESSSVKTSDKTASSISAVSSPKSTPEKKLNNINKHKTETQRNERMPLNKMTKASRICDEDRKKQLVKSPKKNVMSKIKAMIEATSCKTINKNKADINEPVQKRVTSAPKKSRWEAVTSKIAASLAEEKTKPKTRREIRSRVDTNLALARQQASVCRSPKLDSSRGEGSMSPVSVSSRRPLSERNSAPNSMKEGRIGRVTTRDPKHGSKSPRPGKACITSRSNSPVAASESSTSVSLTSHNSRSKIAQWKGSSSTVASSVPPAAITTKRQTTVPPTKPPLQTTRTAGQRMVTKKPNSAANPRITLQVPGSSSIRSLSPSSKARDRTSGKREQSAPRAAQTSTKGPVRPPMWLSKAELTQEIQRLGTLCEARTKELNRLKMETKHVSVGFDAFAALFKYMVEDLNALSVPALSEDLGKTLKQLELTKQDLAYYEREVEEMKSHHCQELNDLSNKLFEVYQSEVAELNAKHQEEINHLKNDHQKQIEHLTSTYDATSAESKAHHDKMIKSLEQEIINQREELQLFQEREIKDLEEKHAESSKLLQEHIEQLQKKCAELKQHSMSMEDAMRKDTDSKLQWVTGAKLDLEKEVESLKAVLEMKNKELHTLRVQNLEMEKQLEELPLAREKIKMLQARAEDLEALMLEKTKLERHLSTENQQIKDTYEKEAKVNRRLSMENEELLWRLRQAENSLISESFSKVPELPEAEDNDATSPTKSPGPQMMSRSVFFTFIDKDESSHSPRSQYKKITPGFSASYKTSPAKSSKSPPAPSPRRAKSHSEPPQPVLVTSTPKRVAKQALGKTKSLQKRQRSGSDSGRPTEHAEVGFSSVTDSMASSVSSESSVFEHRERLLEEHKEHIIHSLEILREQRSNESSIDEPGVMGKKWCSDDIKIPGELSHLETEDMSRSAEFSDPKTYYHMTFPVLKESGIPDCDMDDSCKSNGSSPLKELASVTMHSMSENNIISAVEASDVLQVMSASSHAAVGTTVVRVENKRSSCLEATSSSENVQSEAANSDKTDDRFRTI